jgi:hypothetical protein
MTESDPHVAVRLSIALDSEPIKGSVAVGDGAPREFLTWLELIATLDEARSAHEEGDR